MDKHKIAALWLTVLMLCLTPALADLATKPYTFSPGQILSASSLNADFDAIYNGFNGLISDINIKVGAAIALSKLALNATATTIMASGNPTWGGGVTGDTQPRIALYSNGAVLFGTGSATPDIGLHRVDANTIKVANAAGSTDKVLQVSSISLTTSQSQRLFYASPNSGSGVPTFRAIQLSDLPALGTVTSVALSIPSFPFTISGSPVTTSGTLTATPQAAKGDLIVGTGVNTYGRLTVSTDGKFLIADSTQSTGLNYKRAIQYGGDGSDGAASYSTNTSLTPGRTYNHTTFAVTANATQTFGAIINTTGAVTLSGGTLTPFTTGSPFGSGGYQGGQPGGGASTNGGVGFGPCPGTGGSTSGVGGGGGGGGFANGGTGGGLNNEFGQGGNAPQAPTDWLGSGGGSGGSGAGGTGGQGNGGGGCVRILAIGAIAVSGSGVITCSGGAAINGITLAGGGGGGGGGTIMLWSETSTDNDVTAGLTAGGGNGGNGTGSGADGGGGGGGGYVLRISPSNGGDSGTTVVTGGTGGTGSSAGNNGSAGTATSVTATPNLPLVSLHTHGHGLIAQTLMERAKHWYRTGETKTHFDWDGRQHAEFLSAWYAKPGQFDNLRVALLNGGGREVIKMCNVDVKAAFDEYDFDGFAFWRNSWAVRPYKSNICGDELTEAQRGAS